MTTERDYWAEMRESLELLQLITKKKWEHETTGGGCDAFTLPLPHGYYMITIDASAPTVAEFLTEQFTLGWYTEENYEGEILPVHNLSELKACLLQG